MTIEIKYHQIALIAALFFSVAFGVYGQTTVEQKIDELNQLSSNLRNTNPDSSMLCATQALRLADSLNYQFGRGNANMRLGLLWRYKGEYKTAIAHYKKSLEIRRSLGDAKGTASAHNSLGTCYRYVGPSDSCLYHLTRGLEIRRSLKDTRTILNSLLALGNAQETFDYYQDAKSSYDTGLKLSEEIENIGMKVRFLIGLGIIELRLEQFENALALTAEAIRLAEELDDKVNLGNAWSNLGVMEFSRSNYEASQQHYQTSLGYLLELEDSASAAVCWGGIGECYRKLNQTDSAEHYLLLSTRIAEDRGDYATLENGLTNLKLLYETTGDFEKALVYLGMHSQLIDSVNGYEKSVAVDELLIKYKTAEEQRKNAELVTDKQNLWIGILGLGILVGLAIVILIFLRQRHRNRIGLALKEVELAKSNSKLEGQEFERERIGNDLHDRLGAVLSATKHQLEAVNNKLDNVDRHYEEFERASEMLDEAVNEVRRISHDLSSNVLVSFGLVHALHDLADTVQGVKGINVTVQDFMLEEGERLLPKIEITVYRIVQEAVQNVLKHAGATTLLIRLKQDEGKLTVIVKDDGKGFDFNEINEPGIGIRNMITRAEFINGELTIDSALEKGCLLKIIIPLD